MDDSRAAGHGGTRILIVDDDPGVRFTLRTMLQKEGYSIATAANGDEAMALLKSGEFGLLFLDLEMPIMDGFTLLENLPVAAPDISVYVISAHSSYDTMRKIFEHKVKGFIPKPLQDFHDILAKVHLTLGLGHLSGAEEKTPTKILVVDDDRSVLFALKQLFKKEGYDVETAADGQDAMELLKQTKFKLLILDLELPFMSGFDVLEELQSFAPEMPVLVITAHSSFDVIEKAFRHKIKGYVAKPFVDQEEILKKVRSALDLSAAAGSKPGK